MLFPSRVIVAHAESRAAIDPSAPRAFSRLSPHKPRKRRHRATVPTHHRIRWRCRFEFRVRRLPRVSLASRSAVRSVHQGVDEDTIASTPCHVAENTAGRSSYCVSPPEFVARNGNGSAPHGLSRGIFCFSFFFVPRNRDCGDGGLRHSTLRGPCCWRRLRRSLNSKFKD